MNDIGYINQEYKDSIAYNTVMYATEEQLLNRLPYTINAIEYHKKEHNPKQVKFFTDEMNLIKKRLHLK